MTSVNFEENSFKPIKRWVKKRHSFTTFAFICMNHVTNMRIQTGAINSYNFTSPPDSSAFPFYISCWEVVSWFKFYEDGFLCPVFRLGATFAAFSADAGSLVAFPLLGLNSPLQLHRPVLCLSSVCSAYTAYVTLQGHKGPWRPSHASPGEMRVQKKPSTLSLQWMQTVAA